MFREMIGWAVDEGADILIGETFYYAEEAYTALKVMKETKLSVCNYNCSIRSKYHEG